MIPLRITATLASDIANPQRPPAIDALLAYAVCLAEGRDPPPPDDPVPPVEIPLAREGGVWLASFARARVETMGGTRFTNRRFPLGEAQYLAEPRLRRFQINGGPCKSFRNPLETGWLVEDRVVWYAVGDADAVRGLLRWVGYLGRRRGVGLGKVARWEVTALEASDTWPGFPVLDREGWPLRNLPLDWPGVRSDAMQGFATLRPPYWEREREELCWIPS